MEIENSMDIKLGRQQKNISHKKVHLTKNILDWFPIFKMLSKKIFVSPSDNTKYSHKNEWFKYLDKISSSW